MGGSLSQPDIRGIRSNPSYGHLYTLLGLRNIVNRYMFDEEMREFIREEVPLSSNLSWKPCVSCSGTRHGTICKIHENFYTSNTFIKTLIELCHISNRAQVVLSPYQHTKLTGIVNKNRLRLGPNR